MIVLSANKDGTHTIMFCFIFFWGGGQFLRVSVWRCVDLVDNVSECPSDFIWHFKTWCSTSTWWVSMSCSQEPHPRLCELPNVSEWLMLLYLLKWCCLSSLVVSYWSHGASQLVGQCQVVVLLGASTGCSCASRRRYAFWSQQEHFNCAAEFRAKGPCAHSHIYQLNPAE